MMKKLPIFFLFVSFMVSCGDDDNGFDIEVVPPRLLSEVAPENDEEIVEFLETHFYNYEDFQEPVDPNFDFRVRIDTIAGENSDKTALSQQVRDTVINVSSNQFNLQEDEEEIPHTLYYLEVRPGAGSSPTVGDSTLIKYEGSLLNGNRFDAISDFVWQQLPFFIRGFSNGAAQLKSGTPGGLVINADGTTQFSNSGIGIVFMPSGLAYFDSPPSAEIGAYDPLVFSIEVGLFVENTDSDGDGVPNILEDINENGFLFDDNTDEESERQLRLLPAANLVDIDDDGDGVLTRVEISDADGNIIFPYPDSNGDGTPDYLDVDVQRDPND